MKKEEPGVFIPYAAYWVLTVLCIIFMCLMLIPQLIESDSDESNEPTPDNSWIVEALFADPARDIVHGWKCNPLTVVYNEETPWSVTLKIKDVISQIISISDDQLQLQVETEGSWKAGSSQCAKIFLGVSISGLHSFERLYSDLFLLTYGQEDYLYWKKKGAFNFTFNDQTPCFGFGVYETKNFFTEGFVKKNSPDFYIVGIGNVLSLGSSLLEHCLREELAHVVFFIPDRPVSSGVESIFNANLVEDATDDFSESDRQLIHFIANNPQIVGLDRAGLMQEVDKWRGE